MKIPNEARQREILLQVLKEIRQQSAVRQVDLAKQLNVPQSFVSKYESGTRSLDILELRRICQLIGISLQDFVKLLEERLNETK
ncbi:MAG: helix-turn-helix transcriptional regulator [Chloroflexota bacterium]